MGEQRKVREPGKRLSTENLWARFVHRTERHLERRNGQHDPAVENQWLQGIQILQNNPR